MHNFTYFYDNLLNFYKVTSLKDLSEITNIPISTISSIKQRESITALKKKCRELGIYDKIFDNYEPEPFPPYPPEYFDDDFINANPYTQIQEELTKKANKHYLISEISKMDKTIVSSFISVYQKLEKEGNLIKLYEALGKLKFES